MEFSLTNRSPNLNQKTRPNYNQQKIENLQNCGLCCPGWLQNKTEKSEKKDKYMDLAAELKKTMEHESDNYSNHDWYVPYSHQILLKGHEDLEIRGRMEIIQTTLLLRSARILRRVLETWEDMLSLKLQCKTISVSWFEILPRSK